MPSPPDSEQIDCAACGYRAENFWGRREMLKAGIAGCVLALAVSAAASATTYNVTILAPLAGATNATLTGINDAGQVVGISN
ncbi:hypothetical protein KXW38_000873, partial [Aspergillus fumigatus]